MTTRQATVNGSRGRSAAIVAAATLVALTIWELARMLGVELTVGKGDQASPQLAHQLGGHVWMHRRLLFTSTQIC